MAGNYRRWLGRDPLPWLLDGEEPGVLARALVSLAGLAPDDPRVLRSRAAAARAPAVAAVLRAQHPGGWWVTPLSMYWPQHRATLWQLLILAELGAGGADPRIQRALSRLLVPFLRRVTRGHSRPTLHCLMGYGLFTLLRLGADPAATRRLLEQVARTYAGGRFPCRHASRPDCTWAAVKVLKGLAEVPPALLPAGAREAVDRAARFVLGHRFFFESGRGSETGQEAEGRAASSPAGPAAASSPASQPAAPQHATRVAPPAATVTPPAAPPPPYVPNPDWLRFAFPQFYHSDLLEMLGVLVRLGWGGHPRMAALAAHLARQAGPDGRFAAGRSYERCVYAGAEPRGVPSRWITLLALEALDGVS